MREAGRMYVCLEFQDELAWSSRLKFSEFCRGCETR
jgi:hypothetical protein